MRLGCYEPKARLRDMDEAGVVASLNFPSFPRFAGQTFMEGDDPVLDDRDRACRPGGKDG
jgi:hypothetical protein